VRVDSGQLARAGPHTPHLSPLPLSRGEAERPPARKSRPPFGPARPVASIRVLECKYHCVTETFLIQKFPCVIDQRFGEIFLPRLRDRMTTRRMLIVLSI